MSIRKIVVYLILAVLIAFSLTFITFTTPLGMVLQYPSLVFLIQHIVPRGDRGIGLTILGALLVNFAWGLLPLLLAYRKAHRK